jgi:serine/threonine-protein kinase
VTKTRQRHGVRCGAPLVLVLTAFDATAYAQTPNPNSGAAQAAFDDGRRLVAAGDTVNGCPKLELSERLSPNVDVLLAIADCYERQGRTATAWVRFVEAANAAASAHLADREQAARAHAAALVPVLPKLVMSVTDPDATPGLQVTRDGAPVGPAQWGVAVAADPGPYTLAASAPGRAPWKMTIVVAGAGVTTQATVPVLTSATPAATVAVPLVAPVVPPTTAPTPAPTTTGAAPASPAVDSTSSSAGVQRIIALVSGGLGFAFVGVGVGAGLHAQSKRDAAKKFCDGTACRTQEGLDDTTEAVNAGDLATAGFVAGALGIVGGVTLWFTAPTGDAPSSKVGLGPGRITYDQTW